MKREEGFEKVKQFLQDHPVLYAAVTGFDKRPDVHPAEFCFEEEEAFYFAVPKSGMFYGELSMDPLAVLCVLDSRTGTLFRMKGEAVFTEEESIIEKCMQGNASLREKWGDEPRMLIAWFFRDAVCEFISEEDGEKESIELGTPENALIGITMKKDKELRDRLSSILEERESAGVATEDLALQKLYDGALMYFAETAKKLWPRMDIRPIERSAVFETYDEREQYTNLAKKLIGNTTIDQPEDLTHWLNRETLQELMKNR